MNATRSSAGFAAKGGSRPSGASRRRWAIGLGAGVAVALLGWWFWPTDVSNDPRVVEIRQLQEEARQRFTATGGGPSTIAEAREFVASVGQIREKVEKLPSHLRWAAASGSQNFFFSSMRQRIDDYYAAPPGKRQQLLDQQIRQSDLMRKAFEEAREAQASQASATRPGQQASAARPGQQASAARPGQQGGQNADSGRSRWASRSQDERNEWFRDRILNRTSPEQRAKYVEYRRAASERREQLGLPDGWP